MCMPNHSIKICEAQTGKLQEIDKTTIIVLDFSTPLSVIDRVSRQKINKHIVQPKSIIKTGPN